MASSSEESTTRKGFLGIDIGTQGLSALLIDHDSLQVIGKGEAQYGMVDNLDNGCYEQNAQDWEDALVDSMKQLREQVPGMEVLAIGIAGQMHGEVLMDEQGHVIGTVRLWCDARNEEEGMELTNKLGRKVPKRMTSARFLWTIRNKPDVARKTRHMNTPAGWMAFRLSNQHSLGIGDASGMFPVSQKSMNYDTELLNKFDAIVREQDQSIAPLESILPKVLVAGETTGLLTSEAAKLLGLHEGIPVAPAEGDQPAALAGSFIGSPGTVSCSFGTSVCANSVGDREFKGVSDSVDHFCASDGKPINMIWLRNGTTFLNSVVSSYGQMLQNSAESNDDIKPSAFDVIMPKLVKAPPNCGGLLALPFMDDEPGLHVSSGGSAMIVGWNESNAKPENVARAALMSTCFNLRIGSEVLDEQGYPRKRMVLTGGLAKTPECGQIIADVFNTPTELQLDSSDEGSGFGACLMATFLYHKTKADAKMEGDWTDFLETRRKNRSKLLYYDPNPEHVSVVNDMFQRYKKLLTLVPQLTEAVKK
ncbi:Xylulose kinase [Seminavis robusta]|uniref:Xylulose kinase n=1 Tax=Seminavis robusta TaxID=568900 RepID=A0A9N8HKU5_9STRA|nr:Xylulose kinase [Seminavis robusta]|eukprot:Sro972_g226610.1 Xylulose kinase (534) ;mRNA; r:24108-25709